MIKVSIHDLETNNLITVDMNKYSDIQTLKNIISTKTGIPQNNQILSLNNQENVLTDNFKKFI